MFSFPIKTGFWPQKPLEIMLKITASLLARSQNDSVEESLPTHWLLEPGRTDEWDRALLHLSNTLRGPICYSSNSLSYFSHLPFNVIWYFKVNWILWTQTNQSDDNFTFCFSNYKNTDIPYRERGRKTGYIPFCEFLICKSNKPLFLIWNTLYFIVKHPKCVTTAKKNPSIFRYKKVTWSVDTKKRAKLRLKVLVSQILLVVPRRNKVMIHELD